MITGLYPAIWEGTGVGGLSGQVLALSTRQEHVCTGTCTSLSEP